MDTLTFVQELARGKVTSSLRRLDQGSQKVHEYYCNERGLANLKCLQNANDWEEAAINQGQLLSQKSTGIKLVCNSQKGAEGPNREDIPLAKCNAQLQLRSVLKFSVGFSFFGWILTEVEADK